MYLKTFNNYVFFQLGSSSFCQARSGCIDEVRMHWWYSVHGTIL